LLRVPTKSQQVDKMLCFDQSPAVDHPLYMLGATEEELQAEWEAKGFKQCCKTFLFKHVAAL